MKKPGQMEKSSINFEDIKVAHQAIITRLEGDLRCERSWMLMHRHKPILPSSTHFQTKPGNLLWHIERQRWLVYVFRHVATKKAACQSQIQTSWQLGECLLSYNVQRTVQNGLI